MEWVTTDTGDQPWVFELVTVEPEEYGYVPTYSALDDLEAAVTGHRPTAYQRTKRFSATLRYRGKNACVLPEGWGESDYQLVRTFFAGVNVGDWVAYRGAVYVDPESEAWCLTTAAGFRKAP